MQVTVYSREDCAECRRVWDMLSQLAPSAGFSLREATSPEGAPSPCVRFDAPGSPFYSADGLTLEQFTTYLDDARSLARTEGGGNAENREAEAGARAARRAGAPPTAEYERAHPWRSFLWRHRVGGVITALTLFLGLAWIAPLASVLGFGSEIYQAINGAYRIVCDQIPQRSPELGGLPVSLCWRCTAIYGASLLFGIIYTIGRDRKVAWLAWLTRPISPTMLLLYVLPLIVDGTSHAAGWRSTILDAGSSDFWVSWGVFSADWWLRIVTATTAAVGAVKFLCPRLDKLGSVYERLYEARAVPPVKRTLSRVVGKRIA